MSYISPNHTIRFAWLVSFVVALVATFALLFAAERANASTFPYNCGSIPSNAWCWSPEIHTYGSNRAYGSGTPVMKLCSKLTKPNDTNFNYARKCETAQYVDVWSNGGGLAPWPNNSVSMKAASANGDNGYSLTIYGIGTY